MKDKNDLFPERYGKYVTKANNLVKKIIDGDRPIKKEWSSSSPANIKKLKKIEPYSNYYRRLEYQLLRDWAETFPCKECGRPTIKGYCCTFCGYGGW